VTDVDIFRHTTRQHLHAKYGFLFVWEIR
jgi:hypothetical protein